MDILRALLLALSCAPSAFAQNGTNYHVLHNGLDATYVGIGLPSGATHVDDGLGVWIPGEDLRGSTLADFGGLGIQFSWKLSRFRETACVTGPPAGGGPTAVRFPAILFIELDGLNGNDPPGFTNPVCAAGLGSFIPYGFGPCSSFSFLPALVPSGVAAIGISPLTEVLLPDHGLCGAGGGTATIVAAAGNVDIPLPAGTAAFGCWFVQFQWTPTAVRFLDDIDGLWHWMTDSPDGNQYYGFSTDEPNLWQSHTIYMNDALGLVPFIASADYCLLLSTTTPVTRAVLAPSGHADGGAYYAQTENMVGGGGPNFGFDVGRGSSAVSFSGASGVAAAHPLNVSGFNQGGANNPGHPSVPTLGFVTWGNAQPGPGASETRRVWLAIDLPMLNDLVPPFTPPKNPSVDAGVVKAGGTSRLPVHATGFIQQVTLLSLAPFVHVSGPAPSGWPDPDGLGAGLPGGGKGGGSIHVPLASFSPSIPCALGLPINLTYGSTADNAAGPPVLQYAPGSISGSAQLFLFD